MSFTQALNTIMVRLIKLKYAINIHLTTLDVTYIPNKHTWLDKTKTKHSYFKEKTSNSNTFLNTTQGILGMSTLKHLTGFYCNILPLKSLFIFIVSIFFKYYI